MPDDQSLTLINEAEAKTRNAKIDLSILPPVYVLPTHLSLSELHTIEEQLNTHGAALTYDVREAKLFLGSVGTTKRAKFELHSRKLRTEEISTESTKDSPEFSTTYLSDGHRSKRRKLCREEGPVRINLTGDAAAETTTDSETEDEAGTNTKPLSQLSISQTSRAATAFSSDWIEAEDHPLPLTIGAFDGMVKVVKVEWLNDSLKAGKLRVLKPYIVYEARLLPSEPEVAVHRPPKTVRAKSKTAAPANKSPYMKEGVLQSAVEHAFSGASAVTPRYGRRDRTKDALQHDLLGRSFVSSSQRASQSSNGRSRRIPHLIHQTTSEHDEDVASSVPEMPQWVREHKIYACERATPPHPPNEPFIDQLKKIRLARTLTGDEIGVRAYSSSIASLAAYPNTLTSTREILALPGCDQKIAHLFYEWQTSNGVIQAVEEFEKDPVMEVLRTFYNIWGVGAVTAREFYYDKGWRELDDIIEQGWHLLSRSQQIGLKFYDEFELKIPRSEVEFIASIVTQHARQIIDDGIECVIVGGYRRRKAECGDVDMILSHRSKAATQDLVTPVVASLEEAGWITHILTLNITTSKRGQQTLPYKARDVRGSGFDTLDKALVVWQDPNWPTKDADLAANPKAKNPNVHRRVDIIVSPWRTIGCAVQGWTSGTTFNRDLRRYARKIKGWKYDSSGVRVRGTGAWVDLEGDSKTWEEAERKVFEGFGLEFREPYLRCTG